MRNVRKMKDSGIPWIGQIPEGWEVIRLKNIAKAPLQYGAIEIGDEYDQALPRYIRITDISIDGKLKETGALSLSMEKAQNYILRDGDILFARSGATVGKSFYYMEKYGVACFAGYMIRLSSDSQKALGKFVYYFTLSGSYMEWSSMIFSQATIQNISAEKYANLMIPKPSIEEQRRIVSFLDSRCGEIDRVIEAFVGDKGGGFDRMQAANMGMVAKLKEYRSSLIWEAVTGKVEV